MEAQQIKTLVERALVSYSGTTTSDGAGGGTTLVCSALTALPDYNRLSVLIAEGTYAGLTADIVGSTTGGTINVEPSFPGQIVSGTNFHIIPRLPAYSELVDIMGTGFDTGTDSLVKIHDDHVTEITAVRLGELDAANLPADIDSLLADLGDASAATLGSLLGILGDPAQTFLAMIGYEGATSLADKLTAARAAFLDAAISTRATPAQVNTEVDNALDTAIPGTPTADSINERIKTLDEAYTAARAVYLDELAAANIPADVDTLLTRLSAARAGYLDELDFDLQGSLTAIAGYIDTEINAMLADVGDASGATLGSILGILGDPAQSFLTMIGYEGATSLADKLTAARAAFLDATISTRATPAQVNTEVDNALDTAIPGSPTADSINERIKTLDEAYTAARAVYLDELAAANIPADIDTLLTRITAAVALASSLTTHDTDIKALLGTITGYIDTEVAAILAAVDTEVAAILGLVDSGESAGPYSYLDAGGEQTVVEDTAVTRRRIWVEFSNRNMTQTGTFRIYRKVDGTNYDLYAPQPVTVGAGDERAFDAEFTTNQAWKLTYEEGADEGAARAIPYNVITKVIE